MAQRTIWVVTPKTIFYVMGDMFIPGRGEYRITDELYKGKTDDGQNNVADLCLTATQVTEDS